MEFLQQNIIRGCTSTTQVAQAIMTPKKREIVANLLRQECGEEIEPVIEGIENRFSGGLDESGKIQEEFTKAFSLLKSNTTLYKKFEETMRLFIKDSPIHQDLVRDAATTQDEFMENKHIEEREIAQARKFIKKFRRDDNKVDKKFTSVNLLKLIEDLGSKKGMMDEKLIDIYKTHKDFPQEIVSPIS